MKHHRQPRRQSAQFPFVTEHVLASLSFQIILLSIDQKLYTKTSRMAQPGTSIELSDIKSTTSTNSDATAAASSPEEEFSQSTNKSVPRPAESHEDSIEQLKDQVLVRMKIMKKKARRACVKKT